MIENYSTIVIEKMQMIVEELALQEGAIKKNDDELPFCEELELIKDFIENNEHDLAYQSIVANLEKEKLFLTGKSSVFLLEVGLLMGFKTDRDCDVMYKIVS